MTTAPSLLVTPPAGRGVPGRGRNKQLKAGWGTYLLLGVILVVSVFPVYWTFVAASRDNAAIAKAPPALIPGVNLLENLHKAFTQTEMKLALLNSFLVAATVTFSVVLTSTLAGFAFAKLRFRGR